MDKKPLKIITLLFIVIVAVSQLSTPLTTQASTPLNWNNPNSGTNPYKPKASDFINPQLLMSVIGCTGIVNRISGKIISFVQKETAKIIKDKAMARVCGAAKKVTVAGAAVSSSTVAGTGTPIGLALSKIIAGAQCPGTSITVNNPQVNTDTKNTTEVNQCLNGIAINLAKNQLTAMTRDTFAWVNTGFNGNPFFVTNINTMVDNLQRNVLDQETRLLLPDNNPGITTAQPYGTDFARAAINSYKTQQNTNDSLNQDLTSYLTHGATIDSFSTDFSQGGWSGWLALTQHPQNNPFGYDIIKTQEIADKQATATQNLKDELARNNGYLDQKKCIQWQMLGNNKVSYTGTNQDGTVHAGDSTQKDVCINWQTITPGSAIRDKIKQAINTPEAQLQLTQTINDSLNSLFSALLGKLFEGGISGLSNVNAKFTDIANTNFSNNSGDVVGGANNTTGSFDSTTSLGNKYTEATDSGSWNAQTNTPLILQNQGILNQYYTVSVPGDTKIFDGSYHWNKGDKTFFDGTTWQVGVPKYVIGQKGGLQMQYDFNAASKKVLAVIPEVIPKLGKLDYCIPGPNQNWETNSSDIRDAYTNYINEISGRAVPHKECSGLISGITFCLVKKTVYQNELSLGNPSIYESFFTDLPNLLAKISKSELFTTIIPLNVEVDQTTVDGEAKYITDATNNLWDEYTKKINALYGPQGIMQSETTQDAQGNTVSNTGYLPMATTGLNMTKDIVSQADNIDTDTKNYQDDIVQNNSNIYKLTIIKNKINAIIEKAQQRRATERKANSLPPIKTICLDNEKITYIVNDTIN